MRPYTRSLFRLAATATLVVMAGTAFARPDTRAMTCEQTQRLIARSGAVVLTTGRFTYDRYVANISYCATPYFTAWVSVRTKDNPECPVLNCQIGMIPFEGLFSQ